MDPILGCSIDVEESSLGAYTRAREQANLALSRCAVQDAACITELLKKHQAQFPSLDSTFKLGDVFSQGMSGDCGGLRLQAKVDQVLPDDKGTKDLGSSIQALQTLGSSALFKFCSVSAQGQVNSVIAMLASMMKGMPPRFPSQANPWLMSVKGRLIYFCQARGANTHEALFGMSALDRHVRVLEDTSEGNRTLELFEA